MIKICTTAMTLDIYICFTVYCTAYLAFKYCTDAKRCLRYYVLPIQLYGRAMVAC